MPFTTYTELKAAIADTAHRTDLTAPIVDCITLAEARLYDLLVLKDMESDEALTLTLNQNYVALPTGYISPIAFWLVVDTFRVPLTFAKPEQLPYSPTSSQPEFCAIDGANIRFDCPASSAFTAYLRCLKKSNLSGSVATNYLLQRRPDIYLAASMVELSRYIKDPEMFGAWEPMLQRAVASFKAVESRNRGIAPLRTDIPPMRRHGNIFTGD